VGGAVWIDDPGSSGAHLLVLVTGTDEGGERAALDGRVVVQDEDVAAAGRPDDSVVVGTEAGPPGLRDHPHVGERLADRGNGAIVRGVVQHHDLQRDGLWLRERGQTLEHLRPTRVVHDRHGDVDGPPCSGRGAHGT